MKKIIWAEFVVLLIGTIFAWVNFCYEFYNWINSRACEFGCSAGLITNPFLTPCFYGALFFVIALILNIIVLKKFKSND